MWLSPYYADDLNIFNCWEFPRELLNSPLHGEQYILVVGPDLVKWEEARSHGHRHTYLGWLLEEMVAWCVQNDVLQQQDIIDELRTLLSNGALVPAGYKIEEYLAARQQKQECLRAVLHSHNQVKEIHYHLACIPFRGYITTSYDTCIETAYTEIQHNRLRKFYKTSLSKTVEACCNKQPFILKLYGDLDDANSIALGHRLLTGLYAEDDRKHLRLLFSGVTALFIGFGNADPDLNVLKGLAEDKIIVYQKDTNRVSEKAEHADLPEVSAFARSYKTEQESITASVVTDSRRNNERSGKKVSSTTSSFPREKQDNQEETQQGSINLITVLIYYAREDEIYKDEIEKVLNGLKNKEGKSFSSFRIEHISLALGDSSEYKTDTKNPLLARDLVILLISRYFIGSNDYKKGQIQAAVERHRKGAWISPVLVKKCNWEGTQFDTLKDAILPEDKKPIKQWEDEDEVYDNISKGLEKALEFLADSCPC